MPANAGFEKVSGVKVVRISSPTVTLAWYCPLVSEATIRFEKKSLYWDVLRRRLPAASGSDTVQSNTSQPLVT